ncbi:MAG TPA: ankyrin repeat domain-containing protein [Candidatus Polarisedimenticolia bacterium]|nr:ankyrin repeat domain-containing protein [Candidatus Polarisedimenticolia bacterium]
MTRPLMIACLTLALALPAHAGGPDLNEGLRDAAMKGDLEGVKSLLGKGAEVNAATEFGATPLILAADRGHVEVVKALLAGGADVNKKDTTYDSSPIVWAAYNGHAAVVALLLQSGATGAEDTLGMAIERGHVEVVKAILASGKVPKESLGSALSAAKQSSKPEIAEVLIQAGAAPLPTASSLVSKETLESYVGSYRNEGGFEIGVALTEGRLMLSVPGQGPLELSPKEGGLFQIVGAGAATVTFDTQEGKVTGITVKPPEAGSKFSKVQQEKTEKKGDSR